MADEQIIENKSASDKPITALSSGPWVNELKAAFKNQEKWQEQGRKINLRYLDRRDSGSESSHKINLFTSNVGILISTLYARFPKPLVTREFDDQDDDVARVAGTIIERMLRVRSRDDFDSACRAVVQDRLVPGLGTVWFRYDPVIEPIEIPAVTDPETGAEIQPKEMGEKIIHENAAVDYVFWEDFFWSPARIWEQVRWVGRRVKMSRPDAEKRFGAQIASQLKYNKYDPISGDEGRGKTSGDGPDRDDVEYADVYEIWCKRSKHVYWVSIDLPVILDKRPDQLKLDKFFPCPKPLMALSSTSNVMPRPDYLITQDQYEELDAVNQRIVMLEKAIKVVAIYDGTNPEVERIFQEGIDNKVIPSRSFREFAEKGGFKGAMDWLPIEAITNALEKLRIIRQDLVSQIYEVTGISDIMRGSTKASETLGAQQLKAQYGSVKLQFLQMEVASFVEEALEIKTQIIRNLFQPETIMRESNIENSVDAPYAQQALELIKSPLFDLRVEVHADSMAVPEFTAEREGRMGFVRSVSEMMTAAAPLIEKSPAAGVTMLRVVQWAAASFRTGNTIETVIDKAVKDIENDVKARASKPPAPPPPDVVAKTHKDESQAVLNYAKAEQAGAETVVALTEPVDKPESPTLQ